MTAPLTLTWDILAGDGGARRGSLEDMGGADVENDLPLPNQSKDLSAEKCNQWSRQLAAVNRMISSSGISVVFDSGDPIVLQAIGPGSLVTPSFFEVEDNSNGDTTIRWDEGTLPVPVLQPIACLNTDGTRGSIDAAYEFNSGVVVGLRVRTWNSAGTPTDMAFTVLIW